MFQPLPHGQFLNTEMAVGQRLLGWDIIQSNLGIRLRHDEVVEDALVPS